MLTVVCAMQCLAARGDEVILIGPYWPNVRNVCTMMGAAHVDVRLAESDGRWHLDLDAVAARGHAAHQGRLRQQPLQPDRLGDDPGGPGGAARPVPPPRARA